MKWIKWNGLGGFPLEQNDFQFEQEAFEESIVAVANGFNDSGVSPAIIISGFEMSLNGSTLNIQEGKVLMNGKICHYAGGSYSNSGDTAVPQFVYSSDAIAGSEKEFENGNIVTTQYRDNVTLSLGPVQQTYNQTLIDRIKEHLTFYHEALFAKAWSHRMSDFTTLQTAPGIQTPISTDEFPVQYHIDAYGFYKLRGSFIIPNSFSPATILFELPSSNAAPYPGVKDQIITGCCLNANLGILINAEGEATVYGSGGSLSSYPASLLFSLDGVATFKPF